VYLIAPKNNNPLTTIVANGVIVGEIGDGKMKINRYSKKAYGNDNFTYEVLREIKNYINGDNREISTKQG
jgi:hypothetical protein